jgi:hypothetical protein
MSRTIVVHRSWVIDHEEPMSDAEARSFASSVPCDTEVIERLEEEPTDARHPVNAGPTQEAGPLTVVK